MNKTAILLVHLLINLGYSQTDIAPIVSSSSNDLYLISSLENLQWVSLGLIENKSFSYGDLFLQINKIDVSSTSIWTNGWVPIQGKPTMTSIDQFSNTGDLVSVSSANTLINI